MRNILSFLSKTNSGNDSKAETNELMQRDIKYTDCKIPAGVFFEILETNNFTLLGNSTPEELESVFDKIFDEYVLLENNEKVIQWYAKKQKIALIQTQICIIDNILYSICYNHLTIEERLSQIEMLNSIKGVIVKFDADKPILDEVLRVKNVVIGSLNNRLNIELATEKKQSANVKYSYLKDLAAIENILGYNMPEDMSLEMFVHRKKTATQKAKSSKNLKNGNK